MVAKCDELTGISASETYSQVFIPRDAAYEPLCVASGLSVLSDQFLKTDPKSKRGAYAQAVAYARRYFGCPARIEEAWVMYGLAAFLANAALDIRTSLDDMDRIVDTEERRLALDASIGFTLCGAPLRPPAVEFVPFDRAMVLLGGRLECNLLPLLHSIIQDLRSRLV